MSNNYWDEEDEDQDNDVNLSGDELVKKLRKAKRADEKRIKELEGKITALEKQCLQLHQSIYQITKT